MKKFILSLGLVLLVAATGCLSGALKPDKDMDLDDFMAQVAGSVSFPSRYANVNNIGSGVIRVKTIMSRDYSHGKPILEENIAKSLRNFCNDRHGHFDDFHQQSKEINFACRKEGENGETNVIFVVSKFFKRVHRIVMLETVYMYDIVVFDVVESPTKGGPPSGFGQVDINNFQLD